MSKWNPDDHLPECGVTAYPICICDRLRACEQRVLDLNPVALGVLIAQRARERALDAAREAVQAELGWEDADPSDGFKPHTAIWKFRALAAIDALRTKP